MPFIVVREDTYGTRHMVGRNLNEQEADDIILKFAKKLPLKQDYYKFYYEDLWEVIDKERINL